MSKRSLQKRIRDAELDLLRFDSMKKDASRSLATFSAPANQTKSKTKELSFAEARAKRTAEHASDQASFEGSMRRIAGYQRWLAKMLPGILHFIEKHNNDPALDEYGLEPLDPKLDPAQLLAAVRQRLVGRRARGTLAKRLKSSRAERNALEFALMDAHIASGKSKNEAARLVRDLASTHKETITALLKRYREYLAATKGVDNA